MPTLAQVEEVVVPILESRDALLIDIALRNDREGMIVEIFVDADDGMTTARCADISREISASSRLDGLFRQRYHLIVSSPGVDRPLKFSRQYPKHVGRKMRIVYRRDEGTKTIEGKLIGAGEKDIVVEGADGAPMSIAFTSIVEGRVLPAW